MKKGILTTIIIITLTICFITKVDAANITPDRSRLDIGTRTCSMTGKNCTNDATGYTTIPGTINVNNGGDTSTYNLHFQTYGNNNIVFNQDNTYVIKYSFKVDFNAWNGYNYNTLYTYLNKNFKVDRIAGNTEANSSGQNDDLIKSYSYSLNKSSDNDTYILTISFIPNANLKFIAPYYRAKQWKNSDNGEVTSGMYGFNAKTIKVTSIKMSYTTGTTGAINHQTEIIEQGNEETNQNLEDINETLNQEHEYNNNASEELNGNEEINEIENKEDELMNNLDFTGIENMELTINRDTSNFIWNIVNKLRSMNEKIVILMTSILGLGIIKMILNR